MPPRQKTEPTPADAAIAEAVGTDEPFRVEFRGTTFDIPASIATDARFAIAVASLQPHQILFEALGPQNAAVFLSLVQRGESIYDVSNEFMTALNKAAGWGNS